MRASSQLYVAASRVGHPEHIKFALAPNADGTFSTPNVVYRDALSINSVPSDCVLMDDAGEDADHCAFADEFEASASAAL